MDAAEIERNGAGASNAHPDSNLLCNFPYIYDREQLVQTPIYTNTYTNTPYYEKLSGSVADTGESPSPSEPLESESVSASESSSFWSASCAGKQFRQR